MHLCTPANLVDDLLIGPQRETNELGIVRSEPGKDLSMGLIVTRCEHLFDVG